MDNMLGKIVRILVTIPSEMLGVLADLLEKMASGEGGAWFDNLKLFLRKEPTWVKGVKKLEEVKIYLRQLFTKEVITISLLDRLETFESAGFVIGYLHPDYKRVVELRPEKVATVYELVENGTLAQFFESAGKNRYRWIESEVVHFYRQHFDKLRKDGYATFFELEGGFVASVHLNPAGRPGVYVRRLDGDYVWGAEYRPRVVLPQQKLKS